MHTSTNPSQLCSTLLLLPGIGAQIPWQQPALGVLSTDLMQRWWSAKPKSQRLGHTQPRQPVVSQQQAQCQPGPPTLPWWPRHSAQGTQCLAEPGMPHSHLCTGGHVVTSPTESGLGPIPRPARENPCPGSHGAAGGCDHTRTRRGAGQAIHPPSLTGEAAQLLCPRQSGHHAPHAGAEEPLQGQQRAHGRGGGLCARLASP